MQQHLDVAVCATAGLEVDGGNGTGAVGVFERLGFRTVRRRVSRSRALPAVSGD